MVNALPPWCWLTVTYAITTFSIRAEAWQTTIALTLLYPDNLQRISICMLVGSAASAVLCPGVGWVISRYNRQVVLCSFLVLQKICIVLLMLLLWAMSSSRLFLDEDRSSELAFLMVVLLGTMVRVANAGTQVAIEKDMATAIATDSDDLMSLNSSLKLVDLLGKLAIPLLVSLFAVATSNQATLLCIAAFCFFSMFIEVYLIVHHVFSRFPSLKERQILQAGTATVTLFTAFGTTIRNPVFLTCISMAILYANVLSPGSIVISFLAEKGTHGSVIAGITACAAVFGLLATVCYSSLVRFMRIIPLGNVSLWLQTLCIGCSCVPFIIDPSFGAVSIAIFSFGIIVSRFGLWIFDLVQTQILQESFAEDAGMAFGIQMSLQNIFELVGYGLTAYWSSPSTFEIPSFISFLLLVVSSILFSTYSILCGPSSGYTLIQSVE
ncbi:hypothetical protein BASA62_005152 [Batrachochytrium salamandrivorans]|nr:hypothetical protein BASA62_005152 [Batrachochytrium salamandrivorans]